MIKKYFKDPVSSLTHFAGMFLAIIVLVFFFLKSYNEKNKVIIFSMIVFGMSLILLYGASGVYHMVSNEKYTVLLRKIDHMMIYVLIAGTYTPFCLVSLKGGFGIGLFIFIWVFALVGIMFNMFYINVPNWISAVIYVSMGWVAVFVAYPISKVILKETVYLLVLGGIIYTIGAIIYALKWPKFKNSWFGSHELFHIFILLGSLVHTISIYKEIV